jgi:hypothetical protein
LEIATDIRESSGWFDDHPYDDKEEDGPPWDSSIMKNYDNDQEISIRIMTEADYKAEQKDDKEMVDASRNTHKFEQTIETMMLERQAIHAGRVHYCRPPQEPDWSIPAELQIDETSDMNSLATKNLTSTKTLKYEYKAKRFDRHKCILFKVLSACTCLQELHLHMNCSLEASFFEHILRCAPSLTCTLKVLSIQDATLSPEAVRSLAKFSGLQELDIMNCLDSDLVVGNYNYESDDDEELLYEEPILYLSELSSLKRLDLGYHGESKDFLTEYFISQGGLWAAEQNLESNGGKLTFTWGREPADWSSGKAERKAKMAVLTELAASNMVLSDMAKKQLQKMMVAQPNCRNEMERLYGTNETCTNCNVLEEYSQGRKLFRCGSCHQVLYCSRECQRAHWKKAHKKECVGTKKKK